ncbi:ribose 5-phosphate isomerase B [Helicobacter monodelphidis]|uniref:ribose 5-phosphate isomerase B n=1 Tax=Helicobacter sp. 15-1451 TaxID=2004995 RepID=UPI000DCF3E48|nr:ribose 5-phosphate isomerase B [Helicobacter sp. 15-1451]RAX58138.1 ribose 5-phosphate isomerase B [Helicobacter sp. 15-1451]
MKYIIASDHAGFELKAYLKSFLESKGFNVLDMGTHDVNRVDYPDYAKEVAQILAQEKEARGILICGTGIGMSIAANRFAGIRAALCHDAYTAQLSRLHNDANILCLGARVVGIGTAESILEAFIQTSFEGGRHSHRICKIETA